MPAPSTMIEFERIWHIAPAFDRRDPNPSRDYGIHGCELRMVLKGPLGATQFLLYTNWQLPQVTKEFDTKPVRSSNPHLLCHPLPSDRGYHWSVPIYEDQPRRECEYVAGGFCYYDGSTLNAQDTFELLLKEGSEGVWRDLEAYYRQMAEQS